MMNRFNKECLLEIIAHLLTIEDILMARYNITSEEINKQIKANRENIKII